MFELLCYLFLSLIIAIDVTTLPISDLNKLRASLAEDVELITNNFGNLKVAQSRYQQSLEAIDQLKTADDETSEQPKKIMVPLTGSMYVPGTIPNADTVLVDVGQRYR